MASFPPQIDPSQSPPPGMAMPPTAGPSQMPPGSMPSSSANPLAALASSRGSSSSGSLLQLILTFLAGAGFAPSLDALAKVMGGKGGKAGTGKGAQAAQAGTPSNTPPPPGGPQASPNTQAILQALATRRP